MQFYTQGVVSGVKGVNRLSRDESDTSQKGWKGFHKRGQYPNNGETIVRKHGP